MNKSVATALSAIAIAQAAKIPLHYVATKEWKPSLFLQTGGMPSSHSAGVSALTTYIGLERGVSTFDFALAFVFGVIVMYDAQGIRRQTGELTLRVNTLDELMHKVNAHEEVAYEQRPPKLKEMLGHRPQEVIGGAILGSALSALVYSLSKKR